MIGYHAAGPGFAALLAILAFAASGLGRLAVRPGPSVDPPVRSLVAEFVVGLLVYVVAFGLVAAVEAPFWLGAWAIAGLLVAGLASVAHELVEARRRAIGRIGVAGALGIAALALGTTPVNLSAADPLNYAYITATLFQGSWLATNLQALPDFAWLRDLSRHGTLVRAPPLALMWPAAALGWPLDARTVASLGAWLLVGACALLTDVLRGQAPLLARLTIALGALGPFNVVALLSGGQLNQAFAIAVCAAMLWLVRYLPDARTRLLVLALAGAALMGAYPEFLLAAPLYLVCLCLLLPLREAARAAAAFGVGAVLPLAAGHFASVEYLLTQAVLGPLWWPLLADPSTPLDVWLAIVVQRPPPRIGLVLLVPAAWYAWRRWLPRSLEPRPLILPAVLGLVGLLGLWAWAALRTDNPNYATFKIAGWLGPGFFVLAVLAGAHARPMVGRAVAVVVLVLAVSRALALATEAYATVPLYASGPSPERGWEVRPTAGSCELIVDSDDRRTVLAAIAGSAAPVRGCAISTGQ